MVFGRLSVTASTARPRQPQTTAAEAIPSTAARCTPIPEVPADRVGMATDVTRSG